MNIPNATDLYHFDTFGFLLIENAIPAEQLGAVRAAMRGWDEIARGPAPRAIDPDFRVPKSGAEVRAKMMHPVMKDPAVARLIANPILLPYLDALVPDIRFKSSWADFKGRGGGQPHHANHTPYCHPDNYSFQRRICASLVTVCYAIDDVHEDGGALEIIPGSHKANFPLPDDEEALDAMRVRIPQPAGSAILFTHDANHGSLNRSDRRRLTLFLSYTIGSMANSFDHPDLYQEMRQAEEEGSWMHHLLRRPNGKTATDSPPLPNAESAVCMLGSSCG